MIVSGKGLQITNDEREAWHKDVDVYFQENARADKELSVSWTIKTLKAATQGTDRFVLFCDNLSAQVTDNFKDAVSSIGGLVWYEVPNAADLWRNRHLVGNASSKLTSEDYKSYIWRMWEKNRMSHYD